MSKKTFQIITRLVVDTPASLQTIPVGETVTVSVGEFSMLSTIRSSASRLNQLAGFKEYDVEPVNNGEMVRITRHEKN